MLVGLNESRRVILVSLLVYGSHRTKFQLADWHVVFFSNYIQKKNVTLSSSIFVHLQNVFRHCIRSLSAFSLADEIIYCQRLLWVTYQSAISVLDALALRLSLINLNNTSLCTNHALFTGQIFKRPCLPEILGKLQNDLQASFLISITVPSTRTKLT